MTQPPASLVLAREQFQGMVEALRPELHRYCARLTGSVIEGEDIVQETLANAFYALSLKDEVPPLRPWLFRIAHNKAIDFLKSHGRKYTEVRADLEDVAGFDEKADPAIVRAALARFLALPMPQRSAVILKDVLGHSLEETAQTMETTVMAVKAALVRARARLLEPEEDEAPRKIEPAAARAELDRYAALFNARDWDGLRALIADDCRLDSGLEVPAARQERRGVLRALRERRPGVPRGARRRAARPRGAPARRLQGRVLRLARVGVGPCPRNPRLPLRPLHRGRGRARAGVTSLDPAPVRPLRSPFLNPRRPSRWALRRRVIMG